jgi:hypothetical protein
MRAAVLFAVVLLLGCAKEDDNCTPASEFYTFQMYKTLDTSGNRVSIVNGNEIVFDFKYNYQQCLGVVGAAVSRDIYFQVPVETGDEFSYTGQTLSSANTMAYVVAPIYPDLRLRHLVQGSIHGKKAGSGKWHIIASLNTGTEIVNIDREFLRTE